MSAQIPPPVNRQVLDEASLWFVDFRVGDVDATSRERFDEWLRASPEHIRAYMEIARTYVELPALKSGSKIDTDALIASALAAGNVVPLDPEARFANSRSPGPRAVSRLSAPRMRRTAVAVSLVLCALSAFAWLWVNRYPSFTTEIGENRSITLPDGSTIDLNARSRVEVRFTKAERSVELVTGQALFEVAKDAARPFVVRSGAAVVRAVGTQFDVNRGRSATTVTVVEGRVEVSTEDAITPGSGETADVPSPVNPRAELRGASGSTYVSAGEQVTVTGERITAPQHANVAVATAWTRHRLIFDGTPLSEVVENFNRYNTRPLIIETEALRDLRVSGVYASTDPTSLIHFLKEQPGIVVVESEDAVRIARP